MEKKKNLETSFVIKTWDMNFIYQTKVVQWYHAAAAAAAAKSLQSCPTLCDPIVLY